jgi:AraC-like DNA-binding protein
VARVDSPRPPTAYFHSKVGDLLQSADPLGEALHFLRMSGSYYCRSELTAPFGLQMPSASGCAAFHVVTDGRCWLEAEGTERRMLLPGDFALVTRGQGHRLVSDARVHCTPITEIEHEQVSERYGVLRHGGGGAPTSVICGVVAFDHPAARQLIELLPPVIHIEGASIDPSDWLQSMLRFMAAEARAMRPGGETVITRIADILVIQAIRAWIDRDPGAQHGWLGALQDPQLGRAIARVHRDPAHAWSLAALAAEAGMSRSAFAARFTAQVGEPAMHYVTRWRMNLALTLLREQDVGIAETASRLGYQSEAAFSRAFKRYIGIAPGSARREATPLGLAGASRVEIDALPPHPGGW